MEQNLIIIETTDNVIGKQLTENFINFSSSSGPNIIFNEAVAGTINGSNQTFTLAYVPSPSQNLMLHLNGLLLRQGTTADFQLSGITITFNSGLIPLPGDSILATYTY